MKHSMSGHKAFFSIAVFAAISVSLVLIIFAATKSRVAVDINNDQASATIGQDSDAAGGNYIAFGATQAPSPPPPAGNGSNTIENVINDVWGPSGNQRNGAGGVGAPFALNDAPVEIAQNYDFYHGARPGSWNDVASLQWVQPWCEVVRGEAGVGESNWRVQIKNWRYYEHINGSWQQVYDMGTSVRWGGTYNTKTINPALGNLDFRSDGANGWSAGWRNDAALMHPWSEGGRFQTKNGSARFSTAEMRLIPNTDAGVNLGNVKAYGMCTWDTYPAKNTSDNTATASLLPKHKTMTAEWQHFNSITVPTVHPGNNPAFSYEEAAKAIRDIAPPINGQ